MNQKIVYQDACVRQVLHSELAMVTFFSLLFSLRRGVAGEQYFGNSAGYSTNRLWHVAAPGKIISFSESHTDGLQVIYHEVVTYHSPGLPRSGYPGEE
jgi:hypothetical protein